ncbi:RNA polymerase sigma factor [Streptomyces coffeae]|uniref:RNA polymerase sigma factor n=1 Tax=Streptomyces coffeae TaxID=621382 RepID=UPI0027DC0CF0|nr:RNA polymerase sigma factor [Streptomyces coffeae]
MRTTQRAREGDLVARDEAGIIARVRAGETEAYAELMRAHAPMAHRTAVLLGAGADAEDVVQDAFVKAYLALGSFRSGAAFRPWLLRIVARETSNAIRSARRLRTAVDREGALGGAAAAVPESADPAAMAMAGERRARLMAALDQLSAPQRRVVIHRYLLDLDEAETAEALGWPRGTVKSRLSRALRRLELLLGPDDEVERTRGGDRSVHGVRDVRERRSARGVRGARAARGGGAHGRSAGGGAVRRPGRAAGGARTVRGARTARGAAGAGARPGRAAGHVAPGRAG